MAIKQWFRCPGVVKETGEKDKAMKGKLLDGCWLTVGMDGISFAKGGELKCAHCGGGTQPIYEEGWNVGSGDSKQIKVVLKKVAVSELGEYDEKNQIKGGKFIFACCHNPICSKRYLKETVESEARHHKTGQPVHSGTQYVMRAPHLNKDTWFFEKEDRIDEEGRSWKRCVFCNGLLRTEFIRRKSLNHERVGGDESLGQFDIWNGPAATFRIYREDELPKKVVAPAEASVDTTVIPEPVVAVEA